MADETVRWDVLDGGRLGAVIECGRCRGDGGHSLYGDPHYGMARRWQTCEDCSGSGELFRAYGFPVAEPNSEVDYRTRRLATALENLDRDHRRGLVGGLLFSLLPSWFVDMARAAQPEEPTDG